MLPISIQAGLWGLLAGAGLLIGAAVAFLIDLPHRLIAAVMGLGSGVLIAVLSTDLMEEAFAGGGAVPTIGGFLLGAFVFSGVNWLLSKRGAKHRNRCGGCVEQPKESDVKGSGLAIAAGALLDAIPESIVIGLSLLGGGKIGVGLVVGFFLANVPQGLSSAAGMKQAGRSAKYIFSVWGGIALMSGAAAALGNFASGGLEPKMVAIILAFAAGAVLAMLTEAMIPEAIEKAQAFIGSIAVIGFLAAFLLIKETA